MIQSPAFLSIATIAAILIASCSSNAQSVSISINRAFPGKTFGQVTDIQNAGDGSGRMFIADKGGMLYMVAPEGDTTHFLDLTDTVITPSEMGLLGVAFHPGYSSNGYFYVNYNTRDAGANVTRISRFTVSGSDADHADRSSEQVLLQFAQPFQNHDGGQIAFGPDGYLYIAVGDGGSGGDPQRNGQNLRTLLGTILRIDVDNQDAGKNYGIPESNPYAHNPNYRQEIYAWGMRNPWRISFDTETGLLWAGDVGQDKFEEVDIIRKGGNYGWNVMEGFHCYGSTSCDSISMIAPVWEYPRSEGQSISGGYVYRGEDIPELDGIYVYGDFGSGKIWGLKDDGNGNYSNMLLAQGYGGLSTFGRDESGELYLGIISSGEIYRIDNPSSVEEGDDNASGAMLNVPAPNPATGRVRIPYSLESAATISLAIFNAAGEEVARLIDGKKEMGEGEAMFDTSSVPNGNYYVRLTVGKGQITRKLTILH